MVNVTLTQNYANLYQWPGQLLEADDATTVNTRTASSFVFTYGAGHPFEGYQVRVTGSGLSYDDGVPISGRITQVRILNEFNQAVITFGSFTANTLASDFSQFYANVFGSQRPDGGGPGPDGKTAWSHLMSGNDTINGISTGDWNGLIGVDVGNDVYNMGAGDDQVYGGIGNDTMNGGDGYDRLTFRETTYNEGQSGFQGATINTVTGTITDPWGGSDVFSGFEEYEGSRFNDTYIGSAARDRFAGLRGRDTIDGGGASFDNLGNQTEDRRDEARYDQDYWQGGTRGIVANLENSLVNGSITGTVRDGFGNLDTLIDIERVSGTRYNDTFNGSSANNHFWGGEGKDNYDGKGGFDALRFDRWFGDTAPTSGVHVDLTRATGQIRNDGFGNIENAVNFESVISGNGDDTIKGNSAENFFEGNGGADVMTGGGGADYFSWWTEDHIGEGDRITDFNRGVDVLEFDSSGFTGMTTTLVLVNGTAATQAVGTFIYNPANDKLYWDSDGTGVIAAVEVVQLNDGTVLGAQNFDIY